MITDELIYRSDALKALSNGEGCGNICSRAIRRIPAVDVMPAAHGRWIDADTRTGHHLLTQCSECSFGFYGDVSYWAYCPVCGSKMDGDNDA